MTVLFKCIIDVESHGIKKNSREIRFNTRTKRPFLGKNSKAEKLEIQMLQKLKYAAWASDLKMPINSAVNVKFTFHYPETAFYTKKNNVSKNLADLSNLYQMPEDCLQKANILENDRLICGHDGSRRVPSGAFQLEIEITELPDAKI